MAVLQATSITGGLTMHGMAAGFMKVGESGSVTMDTNTYATTSALSSYLALTGGTMTGTLAINSGGVHPLAISSGQRYQLQVRNTNNSINSGYGWWWFMDTNFNMGFHADGAADRLTLTRDGNFSVSGTISTSSNIETTSGSSYIRVSGIVYGSYLEISGNLPGYSNGQYPVIKSGGTIHFANNGKYSAYLEANDTYFGIMNSSQTTKVLLHTNGASYLTGGVVGIGLNNPSSGDRLEVVGTLRVHTGNNWDAIQIYTDGANGYIQGLGDETGLRIRSEYGNVLLADNRGVVGIGTSSPTAKLHVYTGNPSGSTGLAGDTAIAIDSSGNQFLEFRTSSSSSGIMQGLLFTDNGRNAFIGFKEYTGAAAATYGESIQFAIYDYSSSDAGSGFWWGTTTNAVNGITSPLMFLRSNGNLNVGFGSDNGFRLSVSGTGYASSDFRAPIFYDSQNTAYYLDPASTSNLNALRLNGNLLMDISGGGNSTTIYLTGDAAAHYIKANSYWIDFVGNGNEMFRWYNTTTAGYAMTINGSNNLYVRGNVYVGGDGNSTGTQLVYNSGTWGINISGNAATATDASQLGGWTVGQIVPYHSGSDFPNGTLVVTNINSSVTSGDSFVMELTGKSYQTGNSPFGLLLQGYIYADTFINCSAMSYGTTFPNVVILNYGGNLAFWWPRISYWNSFSVTVREAGGSSYNRVTSISDSTEPSSAKKVTVSPFQVVHSGNIGSQSVSYASSAGNADTVDGYHASGLWKLNEWNGNIYAHTDGRIYGTIFYDANDSGYYLDPNSQSNLLRIKTNTNWYDNSASDWGGGVNMSGNNPSIGFQPTSSSWWYMLHHSTYMNFYRRNTSGSWNQDGIWDTSGNLYWNNGLIQSNASMRAPIFYDSNDTTYYLDPNSTTSAIFRGSVGLNNTSPINTAWGDASNTTQLSIYGSNYGLINLRGDSGGARTYSMGVGDNQFYMAYDNTAARHNIIVNSSGAVTIAVDVRAPIFYDSNDTTYYVDPNSYSRLYRLYIGGSAHNYEASEGVILMQNNQNNHNYLVSNGAGWGSWNQWIRYVAGVNTWRIGTYDEANNSGTSVWRLAGANRGGAGEINYIVAGPRGAWGSNDRVILWNPYARYDGGSYNGDGTNYKILDAYNYNSYSPTLTGGGASGTWSINITGNADTTDGYHLNQNVTTSGSPSFSSVSGGDVYTTSGWFRNHTNNNGIYWSNTGWHLMPADGADFRIHSGSSGAVALRMETNGTTRGYVYAENDNTIGFLNNSRNWSFRTYSNGNALVYGYLTVNGAGTSSSIYMNDSDNGQREIHCNSDRIGFLTQGGSWGAYLDDGTNWYADGSMRAPIFYDSNDTSYYLDPNSDSYLRSLYLGAHDSGAANFFFGEDSSGWYGMRWYWDSGVNFYWYGRNAGTDTLIMNYTTNDNTYVKWHRHFHMNNYEINHAGQFHLNNGFSISQSGSYGYINTWLKTGSGHGIFSDTNGAHLYPNNISYGSWRMDGSRNGWRGINFDGAVTLMMNNNETGFYRDGYGWQWRWENGTAYVHKNGQGGGTSATVLDSTNAPYAWSMNQYVNTNSDPTFNSVYLADGNLRLYQGDGTALRIVTAYGYINIGPQNASWAHIYSGQNFYMNNHLWVSNGYKVAAWDYNNGGGDLYAVRYYDANDTSYYLDPNGTSSLNTLTTGTRARWGEPRWWHNRQAETSDQDYWTGTNGWGTSYGTWANAWKGGFSGWDIWGSSSDHPQGSGYIHAQGIVSGQHYATSDGGQAYGWMMVGAADATPNRYWLRGKWGGSISSWTEMMTSNNNPYAWNMNQYVRTSDNVEFNGVTVRATITVGSYGNSSSIYMVDNDEGTREIHCNSNRIGFLTQSGNWGAWLDDGNNWFADGSMRSPYFYDSNNTGYYGVFSGTSRMYRIDANYLYSYDWVYAQGDIIAYYSDERLKTKVGGIENALDKIKQLNGFYYVNNELANSFGYTDTKVQVGLSAQEVKAVLPEVVTLAAFDTEFDENQKPIGSKSGEDYLTVNYDKLVPLLIEAIKEQQKQIDELKARLN